MKVLLFLLSALAVGTLSLPTSADTLVDSKCIYVGATDAIDCSAATTPEEIMADLQELSSNGFTDFTEFVLKNNPHVTHLPQGMLGEIRFQVVIITDNINLSSVGDILGASKTSVVELDLSSNRLSFLPRVESSSLKTFRMNGPDLSNIAANALNAVPNIQALELQDAGISSGGLTISEGVFMQLLHLQELNMQGYFPKDNLATKGSFTFNSEALHTVNLISSSPIYTAEAGTFGGFNSNTTLSILLNAAIAIPSFYDVFNSGSKVVVQELQPCGCNLDWVKFSCFLPQLTARCVYRGEYYDFADVPVDNFASCCFGKSG